jgi:hypothetical protein
MACMNDPSFVERDLAQAGELTGCRGGDGILDLRGRRGRVLLQAHLVASASADVTHTAGTTLATCDNDRLRLRVHRGRVFRPGAPAIAASQRLSWTVDR